MEDREIIELYWARDERSIRETDLRYGGYLRKIAMNVLSVREDAEECVSDTYQRTWESIPPARPDSLKAWLGRVCRNIALNIWEREHAHKRNDGLTLLLSELEECVPAASPEREAEDAEISACISSWLRSLPAEDRRLFVRRYWYGDSIQELAAEHGTSPAKLSQRMFRLRGSLRKALEKEGISV